MSASGSGFFASRRRHRRVVDDLLERCRTVVAEVDALEPEMRDRTDAELRGLTSAYRARVAAGEPLSELLPEAFATAREAAWRALGVRPHDVQIMGTVAVTLPAIAEMRCGEGKTLTCVLAAYLNALTGARVHVMTANDYLARRDAEWMGPVYRLLGMEAGAIQPGMEPADRVLAYDADVTYGTATEFGFDYLRDNMAWDLDECVQRDHDVVLLDGSEVALLEQTDTPLIISGPNDEGGTLKLAELTVGNYLGLYDTLAGLTSTATAHSAEVYRRLYGLDVARIPAHRPRIRVDHPEVVHPTEEDQFDALAGEIVERHATGQPILVDITHVERARRLSGMLDGLGIDHALLTAGDNEATARIIADAGRLGAVTVLTQCMGHGADVVLGAAADRERVMARGGLCVLGTERISEAWDEHVRGRAGRQGDPGESMLICNPDGRHNFGADADALEWAAQLRAVLDEQRRLVYAERRRVLTATDLRCKIRNMIDEIVDAYVDGADVRGEAGLRALWEHFQDRYPISIARADFVERGLGHDQAALAAQVKAVLHGAYDRREQELGDDLMRELERRVLLSVTDRAWREHLAAMDSLWDRTVVQRPGKRPELTEYRREADRIFHAMSPELRAETVGYLFHLEVTVEEET